MEVLIIAFIVVAVVLFTATLNMVKQFGFISCLRILILALIIVTIMIGVFMVFANIILLIFMKLLFMWLLVS